MRNKDCARGVLAFVGLSCLLGAIEGQSPPSEFLNSFLKRPDQLTNGSIREPRLKNSRAAVLSLYTDNWSSYNLVYNAHAVTSGNVEPSFPPRNMKMKRRGFGLRTTGSRRKPWHTSGMVGWTLTDEGGEKINRFSVAWNINTKTDKGKFAIALGDFVPQFDEMWQTRKSGRLYSEVGEDLDKLIVLADSRVTIAAKMLRDRNHFKLTATVVPQNVDVWGWIKYFKEGTEIDRTPNIRHDHGPYPKVTSKRNNEIAVTSASASSSTSSTSKREQGDEPQMQSNQRFFERKELLRAGKGLAALRKKNETLRDALRNTGKDHSVAIGIHVENWTRYQLGRASLELKRGKVSGHGPHAVAPGRDDVFVLTNEGSGSLTGTSGVVRWQLGSRDRVLSIMWSVPYSGQLYKPWTAVGLSAGQNAPTFDELYGGKDAKRFVRHRGGRDFEFSDGEFLVFARMDGGSTFKPVLHLGLVPLGDEDIAASLRRQIGMSVVKPDDLGSVSADGVEEPPQYGLMSSTSDANRVKNGLLLLRLPVPVTALFVFVSQLPFRSRNIVM